MAFDRTKPYRTRDGRKAEIVATLKNGRLVVVYGNCCWTVSANGHFYTNGPEDGRDLVNIPEKRVVVINHYPNGLDTYFNTREAADRGARPDRLGCTVHEYERPVFDGE